MTNAQSFFSSYDKSVKKSQKQILNQNKKIGGGLILIDFSALR